MQQQQQQKSDASTTVNTVNTVNTDVDIKNNNIPKSDSVNNDIEVREKNNVAVQNNNKSDPCTYLGENALRGTSGSDEIHKSRVMESPDAAHDSSWDFLQHSSGDDLQERLMQVGSLSRPRKVAKQSWPTVPPVLQQGKRKARRRGRKRHNKKQKMTNFDRDRIQHLNAARIIRGPTRITYEKVTRPDGSNYQA